MIPLCLQCYREMAGDEVHYPDPDAALADLVARTEMPASVLRPRLPHEGVVVLTHYRCPACSDGLEQAWMGWRQITQDQ